MRKSDTVAIQRALTTYGDALRAKDDFERDVQRFLRARLRSLRKAFAAGGIMLDLNTVDQDTDENTYARFITAYALIQKFRGMPGGGAYAEIMFGWMRAPATREQTRPFALVEIDYSDAPRAATWAGAFKAAVERLPPAAYSDATASYTDVMLGDEDSDDQSHYRTRLADLSTDVGRLVTLLSRALRVSK